MRVFLAGATGVIGRRLAPLLVEAGHDVAGMTRNAGKAAELRRSGVTPVVCDVFDADRLLAAVVAFDPAVIVDQLTDLPDLAADVRASEGANARIRREGTRNLLAAAAHASVAHFLVQSVAWTLPGDSGAAVAEMERMVLDAGGVVLRYGQFYGPGTYHEARPPERPRIHIDAAAVATLEWLDSPTGIYELVDE